MVRLLASQKYHTHVSFLSILFQYFIILHTRHVDMCNCCSYSPNNHLYIQRIYVSTKLRIVNTITYCICVHFSWCTQLEYSLVPRLSLCKWVLDLRTFNFRSSPPTPHFLFGVQSLGMRLASVGSIEVSFMILSYH